MMGLLLASWLTGTFGFVSGWTTRARLCRVAMNLESLPPRVRGRLRHGGIARRAGVTLRCRHVRRGMRRIYASRIHSRSIASR